MAITEFPGARDLLDGVERVLGFAPRDSVVVVGLGRGGRMGLVMRVDRADCLMKDVVRDVGRAMARHLERAGVRDVVLLSYSDSRSTEDASDASRAVGRGQSQSHGEARCPALVALMPHLRGAFDVRDALEVGGLPRVPTVDAGARRRVVRAYDRAAAHAPDENLAWSVRRLEAWRIAVEEALDGRMPGDAGSGALLGALAHVRIRDAIIIDLNRAFAGLADQLISGSGDAAAHIGLAGLMSNERVDDPARVEAAVDLASHLGGLVAGGSRAAAAAPPFSVAAIGYWWLGDEGAARHYVGAALAADPDYSLATLILATFAAGLGPRAVLLD